VHPDETIAKAKPFRVYQASRTDWNINFVNTESAIENYFPAGGRERRRFDQLCAQGCEPLQLWSFLSCACDVAHRAKRKWTKSTTGSPNPPMVNLTESELRKLPSALTRLAIKVEQANHAYAVGPANFFRVAKLNPGTESRSRVPARIYEALPNVMRCYAADLRMYSQWMRSQFGPKKIDLLRFCLVNMVAYVKSKTGSPNYAAVTHLLKHLYAQVYPERQPPAVFDSAALGKAHKACAQFIVPRRYVCPACSSENHLDQVGGLTPATCLTCGSPLSEGDIRGFG